MQCDPVVPGEVAVTKTKFEQYNVAIVQLYFMGVALILGGQFINWNRGMTMGFWEFIVALAVMAVGYGCLTLCLAEMASMLPFAGGSYGYVRCSLGPFAGYLVGCCEAVAYTLYIAAAVSSIGTLLADILQHSERYQPAEWLMVYAVVLFFQLSGARTLWNFIGVVSVASLMIVILFVFPNISTANVWRYEENHVVGSTSFMEFYHHLPLAAWLFKGIEPMTLTCNNVAEGAAVKVPRAMVCVMVSMIATAFSIVLIAGSNHPGPLGLLDELHPLDEGFRRAYHLSMQMGTPFMIPATVASAYAFLYASSQQLRSMAGSGLLPPVLRRALGRYGTPWVALVTSAVTSYAVLLLCYYVVPDSEGPAVDEVADVLFSICMMCTCAVNLSLLVAYWIYHQRFSALDRGFRSPLGRVACVVSGAIFAFMAGSLAFAHRDNFVALAIFVFILLISTAYYYWAARRRQFFSEEEQEKFFKVYVLNANQEKRNKKKMMHSSSSGGRVGVHSASTGVLAAISHAGSAIVGGVTLVRSTSRGMKSSQQLHT